MCNEDKSKILVRELHEKTGARFMDCKKALHESNNDMDKAISWLLEKRLIVFSGNSYKARKYWF